MAKARSIRVPEPLREQVAANAARRRAQMEAERAFVDGPVFEPCDEPALRLLGLRCARSERAAAALSGGVRWA